MSVCSSVALNALRYTRTSSIRPLKYSPYRLFPPIHNGLDDTAIAPVRAALARCTPFTNNRTCDPSYVNATCDHTPTGNAFAAGAVTNASIPPNRPPPADRNYPVCDDACMKKTASSFSTTVRQPDCDTDGNTHAITVIADDRSNDAESATLTRADDPSNDNSPPYFPADDHDSLLHHSHIPKPRLIPNRQPRTLIKRIRRHERSRPCWSSWWWGGLDGGSGDGAVVGGGGVGGGCGGAGGVAERGVGGGGGDCAG